MSRITIAIVSNLIFTYFQLVNGQYAKIEAVISHINNNKEVTMIINRHRPKILRPIMRKDKFKFDISTFKAELRTNIFIGQLNEMDSLEHLMLMELNQLKNIDSISSEPIHFNKSIRNFASDTNSLNVLRFSQPFRHLVKVEIYRFFDEKEKNHFRGFRSQVYYLLYYVDDENIVRKMKFINLIR